MSYNPRTDRFWDLFTQRDRTIERIMVVSARLENKGLRRRERKQAKIELEVLHTELMSTQLEMHTLLKQAWRRNRLRRFLNWIFKR